MQKLKVVLVRIKDLSLVNIIGIFLEDGLVCTYYNVRTLSKNYSSGDIIELPRHGQNTTIVILGIHENLGQAAALAKQYFKRICKWDGVEDTSSLKLFGHDLVAIEEEVTQIEMFETQGIEGPPLLSTNCFDLLDLLDKSEEESQDD